MSARVLNSYRYHATLLLSNGEQSFVEGNCKAASEEEVNQLLLSVAAAREGFISTQSILKLNPTAAATKPTSVPLLPHLPPEPKWYGESEVNQLPINSNKGMSAGYGTGDTFAQYLRREKAL